MRVESCTLFPNVNTIWRDGIPERCYRFTETLVDNIYEQRKKKELSKETIQRAVEALDKCVYGEPPMTEEEFEAKVNCSPSRGQYKIFLVDRFVCRPFYYEILANTSQRRSMSLDFM